MLLDYENAYCEEIEVVRGQFDSFATYFALSRKRYALHEQVVKPELELVRGVKIAEIGVGQGFHLGSYSGLDYWGFDTNWQVLVNNAFSNAQTLGIPVTRIRHVSEGEIPLADNSIDRLISICVLHEVENLERVLGEMHRLTGPDGRVLIAERMAVIDESAKAIERLKQEPELLRMWFSERGYDLTEKSFKATYFGELVEGDPMLGNNPLFNYYLFSARKRIE